MPIKITVTYEVSSTCRACGKDMTEATLLTHIVEKALAMNMRCKFCDDSPHLMPARIRIKRKGK